MSDHVARPGPMYWDYRCLICGETVDGHTPWWRLLLRRIFRREVPTAPTCACDPDVPFHYGACRLDHEPVPQTKAGQEMEAWLRESEDYEWGRKVTEAIVAIEAEAKEI